MGTNIVEDVGKLRISFSLQIDKSTDVTGNTQHIAFVRNIKIMYRYNFLLEFGGGNNQRGHFYWYQCFLLWKWSEMQLHLLN